MSTNRDIVRNSNIHTSSAITSRLNEINMLELHKKLHQIDILNEQEHAKILARLGEAFEHVENVESFASQPSNILGSANTKHGEVAEHINVEFRNAERIMRGKEPNSSFDGVGRTAPVDYLCDGIPVQSKYYKKSSGSLSAVLNHLKNDEGIHYGKDNSYYEIPRDQYDEILKILSGDTSGMDIRTVNAILKKISEIEQLTGRPFTQVVRSGKVGYDAVQPDALPDTVDDEKEALIDLAHQQRAKVDEESRKKKEIANESAKPTWEKAVRTGAIAAATSGSMQFAFSIYKKCKNGKKVNDFTIDDWKEIGLDTARATAEGGITGITLYGLTNVISDAVEPAGAAGMSLIFGISELAFDYHKGKLGPEEFRDACSVTAINSVICAIGAAVGKGFIPIPVLGSVIGSFIAGKGVELLLDEGLSRATKNATLYVYGMTCNLQKNVIRLEQSIQKTSANMILTTKTMDKTTSFFDTFEKMKR